MSKKIKICALTTISKTMDWFVVDNMRNLANNGYEVTLICNMEQGFRERNADYATCINIPMKRGVCVKDLMTMPFKLKRIFKQNNFDIIFYTSPNVSLYSGLAGKSAGVKNRVYCQYGLRYISCKGVKRELFKAVEKISCSLATTVRSASPKNRQTAIEAGLCDEDKIKVLGIGGTVGVDLKGCDKINKPEVRKTLRKKYNIPESDFLFGFVGRINADKGINELIEAFLKLSEERSDISLCLVGMLDDTNKVSDETLKKARENDKIFFTGNVPPEQVYSHLAMFDVLVHPTYREGFGKVLQEAMGMSVPILTTDVIGASEVVEKDISGLLVKPADVEDLKRGMERLLSDEALRDSLAKNGRARAAKYFDRPIMLANILEDLNSISQEKS